MVTIKYKRVSILFLGYALSISSASSLLAEPLKSPLKDQSSSSLEENNLASIADSYQNIKSFDDGNHLKCDFFEDQRSSECIGEAKGHVPTSKLEELIQKTATYSTRLVPLLNKNSGSDAYKNLFYNDAKNLVVDAAYGFTNTYANEKIQKIPFLAQTTIGISPSESETSFSIDSLLKLKEISRDKEGDLKTLLFSQAKLITSTHFEGSTTNLGLGIRHRPNDISMYGFNAFWDYRLTNYSSGHSRIGLGGEYFWKDLEFRNNWYIAATDKKSVIIDGSSYTERVVPGWDLEIGYRLPKYPEVALYARAFNWDYKDTQDNSGLEGSINWQLTPHMNIEAWVSNEINANDTKVNTALPATDETFFGLRMKLTGQPVNIYKNKIKENIISQMVQPVRRRYDVLLERSTGSFTNRAKGK